jgi:pSer/pThr/pTyr-binding forkhead associated (FHA) protein
MHVKLVVVGGKNHGREISIAGLQFLIGRAEGCQLRPASDRVSRKHCVILVQEGRVLIRDLKSTNHTYVNQEEVIGDRELKNGDHLNVADVLEFEIHLSAAVEGKRKSKVHSIQEAAARSRHSAPSEELDISVWLENAENAPPLTPAVDPNLKNTRADQSLADTTSILAPLQAIEKNEDKKISPKVAEHPGRKKKPSTESSVEAAEDTLRQFFGRKR